MPLSFYLPLPLGSPGKDQIQGPVVQSISKHLSLNELVKRSTR